MPTIIPKPKDKVQIIDSSKCYIHASTWANMHMPSHNWIAGNLPPPNTTYTVLAVVPTSKYVIKIGIISDTTGQAYIMRPDGLQILSTFVPAPPPTTPPPLFNKGDTVHVTNPGGCYATAATWVTKHMTGSIWTPGARPRKNKAYQILVVVVEANGSITVGIQDRSSKQVFVMNAPDLILVSAPQPTAQSTPTPKNTTPVPNDPTSHECPKTNTPPDDPHAGMEYNAYTDTWNWC